MKSVLKNAERKPFPVESITSIAGAIEGKTLLYAVQTHVSLIFNTDVTLVCFGCFKIEQTKEVGPRT